MSNGTGGQGRAPGGAAREAGSRLGSVLVPNFGSRYSGVTSVIRATLPHLQRRVDADLVGRPAGSLRPAMTMGRAFLNGFGRPRDRPFRIWHARRNVEMVAGLVLRAVLRWPVRVVFTSAGLRQHTPYTDWLIGRMDAVIATTAQAAAFLHRPSVVIPHGVDCDVFVPEADRDAAWAARGPGGRYGIGVFGRVRHQKGTDLFVEALVHLLPRHPDFTGIVVGLCKPKDAAYLDGLRQQVAAAGLTDRIVFLGEVPPDDLPGLLAGVSICVAPQRHEGFGLVPLEAAASATPVVAARSGAADEILDDGVTGLLVEADAIDPLTEAIDRLMADAGLRARMGAAARRRAVESFAITREIDGYLDVYRSLWSGRRVRDGAP